VHGSREAAVAANGIMADNAWIGRGVNPGRFLTSAGSHAVSWRGGSVDVKLTAAQTDGRVGMWFWQARGGDAAPLHLHHLEDERFLVIAGQARFLIGEESLDASAGDLVFLPREIPHAYLITSETACLVGMVTPGGFESFFAAVGAPVSVGRPHVSPRSDELFERIASRYGIEIVGAPPVAH
jgi:mannose-6-phosphate isomerase-like protein (cupin superfamily)